MACAPSEDSDQPGHPSSLIRVFAIRMKKALILSYPLSAQRRLWSDWADAQADLSLRWAHMPFCCFCHALGHMANISHNLATLRSWSYEVLVPGQINEDFLLVLREMGQVGHIGHGISIALVYAVELSKLSTLSISSVISFKGRCIYTGMWNYQILLLVHGQVNGQNPLAQPRFTCPKINGFFLFLEENIGCGYSLEAPNRGASNEYPQPMFSSRNKKNVYLIYLHTLFPEPWITCPRTTKLKFLTCFKGNGSSWISRAWHGIYIVSFLSIRTDRPVQAVYKVEKHVTCDVSIHTLPSRPFWISFLLRSWFSFILRLFTS